MDCRILDAKTIVEFLSFPIKRSFSNVVGQHGVVLPEKGVVIGGLVDVFKIDNICIVQHIPKMLFLDHSDFISIYVFSPNDCSYGKFGVSVLIVWFRSCARNFFETLVECTSSPHGRGLSWC